MNILSKKKIINVRQRIVFAPTSVFCTAVSQNRMYACDRTTDRLKSILLLVPINGSRYQDCEIKVDTNCIIQFFFFFETSHIICIPTSSVIVLRFLSVLLRFVFVFFFPQLYTRCARSFIDTAVFCSSVLFLRDDLTMINVLGENFS